MDTPGKRIFLKALTDRKALLFGPSAAPGAEKDRLWQEVYDECKDHGCSGMRDVDHLRKTTWQNLQRRAKDKFERSRRGEGNVTLSEIDNMVINIIGTSFINTSPEHSFSITLGDDFDVKPEISAENIDPLSLDSFTPPTKRAKSDNSTIEEAFVPFNNPLLDFTDTSSLLLHALQQQQQQDLQNREREQRDDHDTTDIDDEESLRMRKLRAEVRKLEAEADKSRAEADSEAQRHKLLKLDIELRELQIMKLKKELSLF